MMYVPIAERSLDERLHTVGVVNSIAGRIIGAQRLIAKHASFVHGYSIGAIQNDPQGAFYMSATYENKQGRTRRKLYRVSPEQVHPISWDAIDRIRQG